MSEESIEQGRQVVRYDPARLESDRRRVRRGFWKKVRKSLGRVPFLDQALAAYYCATDPATPLHVKGVLLAALAYFVTPTDLIPDFITTLGYTDDAAVLFAAIRTVQGHINEGHRVRAFATLARLKDEA